jgi:transcriptional regulator with XRE-family HTH domain
MIGMDVAVRCRAAGLSQRALAAKLGVSQQWVAALERDVYPITLLWPAACGPPSAR